MAKANNNRNAKKSDVWLIDPEQVCIVGGAGVLKDDEAADIDTAEDVTHPLYDERVRRLKVDSAMVANVNAFVGDLEDAFTYSALAQGVALDLPTLEPANRLTVSGNYTGFIPPGFATGFSYTFVATVQGPSTIAGGGGC